MAKYIKQEMPNLNNTDEPQVYYRMKTNRNISSKEFVQHICRSGSALDKAQMEGFIIRMADDPDTVFSTRFHEYKSESGFIFPSRIVSSTDGGAPVTCTIRDVKINPELPDELFRLPEPNG